MSPTSSLSTAPFPSSPLATASATVGTMSAKQLVWQTIVYFVVVTVIVAIITGTVLIIWNGDKIHIHAVICERLSVGAETVTHLSPFSEVVRMMQHYFFMTLWPAFPNFRQANTASLGSTTLRSRPVLPRFSPLEFREQEHQLATLPPLILRDSRSSFRVPPNPGSVTALSSLPASRSLRVPAQVS